MKQIRIGNDIRVQWTLLKDGKFFSLEDLDVTLYLKDLYGKKAIEEFSISGNIVSWTFYGKDQKHTGKYSLELTINEDKIGMVTTDICDFVNLVPYACKAGGSDNSGVYTETIELTSSLGLASIMIDDKLSTKSANPVQNKVVTAELSKKVSKAELDEKVSEIRNSVDSALSFTSTNPVQNRVVTAELEKKAEQVWLPEFIAELERLYDGRIDTLPISYEYLKNALKYGKYVCCGFEDGSDGYYVLSGHIDDFMYLQIFTSERRVIELEIPLEAKYITAENIYVYVIASREDLFGVKDEIGQSIKETNNAVSEMQELVHDFNDDIGTLYHKVDEKPNKDEYVPSLSVGLADNLIGRGEATEAEFTFRATGGGSINDGDARIESIKGNSVVWNQLIDKEKLGTGANNNGLTFSIDTIKGTISVVGNASNITAYYDNDNKIKVIKGHKYLLTGCPMGGSSATWRLAFYKANVINCFDYGVGAIATATETDAVDLIFPHIFLIGTDVNLVFKPRITDLTLMFGVGNEPTTMEEFYSRIPQNIDLDAYNEGEIIDMNVDGIKSVGFNAWDEQWELGLYSLIDGEKKNNDTQIRSKNYIDVLPNAKYRVERPSGKNGYVIFFDSNKSVIGNVVFYDTVEIFTTPTNAAYITFYMVSAYGATYNNDICIHLVHSGYRNGQYEPYVEYNRNLSLLMSNFPNGLRSVPSACDEVYYDRIKNKWYKVQRVGEIDLGSLTWGYISDLNYFYSNNVESFTTNESNVPLVCKDYVALTWSGFVANYQGTKTPCIALYVNANTKKVRVNVFDSSYTDAATFKAAMQGVILYYELAEPIVTELPYDGLNLTYQVSDFGTEKAIASKPTSAFRGGIVYAFNAVDMIRELKQMVATLTAKLNA